MSCTMHSSILCFMHSSCIDVSYTYNIQFPLCLYMHILITHAVFKHHDHHPCYTQIPVNIILYPCSYLYTHHYTHSCIIYVFLNHCYHYLSVHTIFSIVITSHHIIALCQIMPFILSYTHA